MMAAAAPLVGRVAECQAITAALTADPPQSLVIVGPPGVGRTRLAQEAAEIAAGQGRLTRWGAATTATAGTQLGALAHLLPPMDAPLNTLPLLQHVARSLSEGTGGQPPLLVVDDVHLLDPLSLNLLHQLAASGTVTLVLTVCTDRGTTDPVSALWKDGRATRLQLQALSRPDADELARVLLHGEVDSRTAEKLWGLSQGNPLFLVELIAAGWQAGQLRDHRGVWRWLRRPAPSQRLAEIVLTQLGELSAAEWTVLEVLAAAGEPLNVARVVELSSAEAVAALARRRVVVDDAPGHSPYVRAAHPLYTEVVRFRASRATLRAISHRLIEGQPLPNSAEKLRRRGELMLDRDAAENNADLLIQAAHRANALFDHELAEPLARAAIESGGGIRAHLALAEATQWLGRAAEADQVALRGRSLAAPANDLVRLAATRAAGLGCGLGSPGEAFEVLWDAGATAADEDDRLLLSATEAHLMFLAGSPQRAVEVGKAVLKRCTPDTDAGPLAGAAVAAGLAVTGQCAQALAAVTAGWQALELSGGGPQAALAHLALAQAETLALLCGGRIREMEHRAIELHERNLAGPEWAGDAVLALHRGRAALAAGHTKAAVRWLREALAGLEQADPTGARAVCVADLATAEVLAGNADGARAVDAEGFDAMQQLPTVLRPQAMAAQAWLAAASDRVPEAGELALAAAAEAASTDQRAIEALLLHTAARFGRAAEVCNRLATLAEEQDSVLVSVCADHVQAGVARNGRRLDEVSALFRAMGATLMAADAAADAAAAHERDGDRWAAGRSRATASALARECELGSAPGPVVPALSPLTPREAEIAAQAARGASNQRIAARLVLSVRTVETHLAHAYAKLGISGRRDLAEALGFPTDEQVWRIREADATPAGCSAKGSGAMTFMS